MNTKKTSLTLESPPEKFRKAMRQILSVPKAELERREVQYRKERKAVKKRSHGV
jgi:predicted phosphoribosyltransferase